MRKLSLYIGLSSALLATPAYSYIGPGAGAGTIAVVLGVLASVFLAFVAILWYPLKRLLKKRKGVQKESTEKQVDTE